MTQQQIIIFDTTLRDGEQSPGASMTLEEKIRIASALEGMGVDVIEAGFPAASNGDFEAVQRIAATIRNASVCGLARAQERDITRTAEALKGAAHPRIHTFIATSPLHMKYKLRMQPEQVLEAITHSVRLARNLCGDVEWSCEDGSRSDIDFLCRAIETAIAAGARTINIPDTVGYAVPDEFGALFRTVMTRVPNSDKAIFSAHCHNDLGLAVANALAAVQAGARQVECTINGLGERAGNAALEEIVMALRTRQDALPFTTRIKTEYITQTSRLVSAITGFAVQPNKAIVGANAFAHESGIHQDGMLKNAQTYEIMTPESVGLKRSALVMGKHSGRHAFREKLKDLGYGLDDTDLDKAFLRFKDLADRKKQVYDEDIIALVDTELSQGADAIRLVDLKVTCGTTRKPQVELTLTHNGTTRSTTASGDGPVDATFNAIRALVPHAATLQLFQVHAVTEGTDAQAEVTVRLEEDGKISHGQGADTDTLVAAALAYLHALGKVLVKRERGAPDQVVVA
jgi:2-isopropylmalate synthase